MKMASQLTLLVVVCFMKISDINAQNCPQSGNGDGLPTFQNYGGREDDRITVGHQAIIPTYKFDCNQMCGNITAWGVDVQPGGGRHDGLYTLDLQVWRPSPTVDESTGTGCYSLVGSNRFTSMSLANDLARVTPSPQNYIQFQPGDVLGFYVEEGREDNNGVNVLNARSNDIVWYGEIDSPTSTSGSCPYSVGGDGVLDTSRQAAPVISIATVLFSCPTQSLATTQPTPPPQPPTTDNIGTLPPPTQEPVGPTDSGRNGGTDPRIVTTTDVGPRLPITSESVIDGRVSTEGANIGLIIGIIITVLVLIAVTLVVVIIVAVVIKKHRENATKGQSFANIGYYSTTAGNVKSVSTKKDIGETYDYIIDEKDNGAVYEDTVLYHSMGPDVSQNGISSGALKSQTSRPKQTEPLSNIYEAPVTRKLRESSNYYETPQTQDVFDRAGFHVPTWNERTALRGNRYEYGEEARAYNKLEFFVEEDIYWAPAATTSDLYTQLASRKYREIPRNQLTVLEQLGSGEFGKVCKALWSISGATKELAIKTVRPQLPEEEKVRFLQEAAIMGQFCHPNVVKLYGVVTLGDPVMICIELLSNGDLRGYLGSLVTKLSKQSSVDLQLEKQLLQFSKQVASGMNYLSNKSFVHRDLAARNILLDKSLNCKIADFGMARDLEDETYYTPKSKVGKIPIKWTAPEALLYKKYSTDSDVWSYGMVLFEIWSVGKKPLSQFSNAEVLKMVNSKYNQPPPPGCPRAIYKLMVDCWHPVHSKRPRFSEICDYFKTPTKQLLWWNDEDNVTSQQARTLGAPLSESQLLFQDLQNIYKAIGSI